MSTLAEKIQALNTKANDTSLSLNEREVSRKMAKKLHKKLIAQGGNYQKKTEKKFSDVNRYPDDAPVGETWVVPILKYATAHPDYDKKIKIPLESWGCTIKVRKDNNALFWAVHNQELAIKANQLMKILAVEGFGLEENRKRKETINKKHNQPVKENGFKNKELKTILLAGTIFVILMIVFF